MRRTWPGIVGGQTELELEAGAGAPDGALIALALYEQTASEYRASSGSGAASGSAEGADSCSPWRAGDGWGRG